MSDFTDEDVERARRVCAKYAPSAESDTRLMAEDILAAVLPEYAKRVRAEWDNEIFDYPSMRAKVLREAADDLDAGLPTQWKARAGDWLRARANAEEGK